MDDNRSCHQAGGKAVDPLPPGDAFKLHLVAGATAIAEYGPLDFFINRPNGMPGFIISLTVSGRGKVFEGADAFEVTEGGLLLFPPNIAHYYGRSPKYKSWHHRWVYFRPRTNWVNWLRWPNPIRGVGRLSVGNGELFAEFDGLFQQIDQAHRAKSFTAEELAMNLLERLLIRCFEVTPENRLLHIDERIKLACQYITSHLNERDGLDDIARLVFLSPSRLSHLFREQTGVSILCWREDQRLALAKHLLKTTRKSMSAIAELVGYRDQLYFSRIFSKRVGISPRAFRKQAKEQIDYSMDEAMRNQYADRTAPLGELIVAVSPPERSMHGSSILDMTINDRHSQSTSEECGPGIRGAVSLRKKGGVPS